MCELTHDMRRTTMDIDLDFIHCSIEETSIRKSVDQWAKTSNLQIVIIGEVKELRQDDYRGKRIYLDISDGTISHPVRTKVDIGVHVQDGIKQDEFQFGVLSADTLLANPKEQIFVEKLLSLLRHGIMSTRTKDIFDMFYLKDMLDRVQLVECMKELIFNNVKYSLNNPNEIMKNLKMTFASKRILRDMNSKKSNWIDCEPADVVKSLLSFIDDVLNEFNP